MDIQNFLHNLHEEVSCPVCMTKFTDPKQLPCLHSFCLHCLQRIQQTSGIRETISCPECRQNFRIPQSGDLNALPTNFRINSLLDVLAIKECNTSGVKCGNCDRKSGESSYCFQCCSFWCDDCISSHNAVKIYRDHYALALKDFQDEDFENILRRPAFCQQKHHEQEELKFFCKGCEATICNTCALTDHEGHAKMLLQLAANERKLRLKSAIETHRQKAEMKTYKIAKLDENCVKAQQEAASVKRDVQQFVNRIIEAIEAKKMEIFDDVENKVKEFLERLGMERREMEERVKLHETAIEKSQRFLKRSTSAQIMQGNEFLDRIFQDQGDQMQEDGADLESGTSIQFKFVKNQQIFDNASVQELGFVHYKTKSSSQQSDAKGKGIREATVGLQAEFVVTTRNAEGKQCYEERDCVTVEIRNHQGRDCATIARVQDNKDGTYKVSYFAKETGTCQASVKINGEHVRSSLFEVQVQPRQHRPVECFGQFGSLARMFSFPWGVAVNDENEIAVTEFGNHSIQIFNSDGRLLGSFGRKGSQQGEFNWPAGIALHKDHIIVADNSNHRVQLFTHQGEYVGQLGGKGSLDHHFNGPLGLSIDSDGNIIVADSGNKLIKIFSLDGQFLRKIGTKGSLINPFHCIQHGNYHIVSDAGDDSVKVFDREGTFLHSFGKRGNKNGEFNNPVYLSVNKADQLMVCDRLNHRIQVFEFSGKFLSTFGQNGRKPGEFNNPVSTAVLNDGRIVVSEFCNHRIQIFE